MNNGTYVSLKVKNNSEFYNWFKKQGINVEDKENLHCTLSYSRKEFIHKENKEEVIVSPNKIKSIEPLGNDGAIVLKFESDEMQKRFNQCMSEGATYDYDEYIPHITITYDGKDLNLKDIEKPNFDIVLHNEKTEPLNLDWKEKLSTTSDMFTYTRDKGFGDLSPNIDEDTGFLEVYGTLARTGVQDYYGFELGEEIVKQYNLDPMELYGVYRPKEEVLDPLSLESYINKPVTDNHPKDFVTVKNIKELGKGSASSVQIYEKDGIHYVKGRVTVKDEHTINKVLAGKKELSNGYKQMLVKEDGIFDGKSYKFKQTNIRINHIAIVDKGRCGDNCKITTDNFAIIKKTKGSTMVKLKIGDAEVEVCDTVLSHINSLKDSVKKLSDENEELEKDKEELEKDMEKLEGENEKLKEDMEEEKSKTSDSITNALVSQKVALIDTAKTLKVEVKATDSIMDMKKSIISANSKISLDGKSDEFIDGVYETVIASTVGKQKAIKDSQSKAFDGFEAKPQTTNDAYNKYVDRMKNAYRGEQ